MSEYAILVNKNHPLKRGHIPNDLTTPRIPFQAPEGDARRLLRKEAAEAAEQLFCLAEREGIRLAGISGYRPYERQEELYAAALKKNKSLLAVAPPGCSEHQTGLALDVSCAAEHYELEETFADTREGKWLASSASLCGFILRYPKGREHITGYPYEPWHIRYVGIPLAFYMSMAGMTLEEYVDYHSQFCKPRQ